MFRVVNEVLRNSQYFSRQQEAHSFWIISYSCHFQAGWVIFGYVNFLPKANSQRQKRLEMKIGTKWQNIDVPILLLLYKLYIWVVMRFIIYDNMSYKSSQIKVGIWDIIYKAVSIMRFTTFLICKQIKRDWEQLFNES